MSQPDNSFAGLHAEKSMIERNFVVVKKTSDLDEVAALSEVVAHLDNRIIIKLLQERLGEVVLAVEDLGLLLETLEKREQPKK